LSGKNVDEEYARFGYTLGTTTTTCAGLGCAFIFAFIGSVIPRRAKTLAIE
jgi:hypothetical protein